jgi:hypothetical protein
MIVIGTDVGNATTELAVGRLGDDGQDPEVVALLRAPSSGPKGARESLVSVRDLIEQAPAGSTVPPDSW